MPIEFGDGSRILCMSIDKRRDWTRSSATLEPSKALGVGGFKAHFLGACSLNGSCMGWLGVGLAKMPNL